MSLMGVSLVYGLMLYGCVLMFVSFGGPFNILEKFRNFLGWLHPQLGELISCPFCTATWIGGIISALNYLFVTVNFTPFNIIFDGSGMWWLIIPLDTFYGCGVVWILHLLDEYLEGNTPTEYED